MTNANPIPCNDFVIKGSIIFDYRPVSVSLYVLHDKPIGEYHLLLCHNP